MVGNSKFSACGEIVKQRDPDRFLTCLFAQNAQREALFALYAFNYEIAKVRSTVSEPMLGQIRLQWWREAIDECYNKDHQRRHEVVQPLYDAITRFKLSRIHFDALIDAREQDFDNEKFKSLNDLAYYAAKTNAPLMWLACEIFNRDGEHLKIIAESIGTAWAMIGLMRATPFLLQTGSDALPREILQRHGLISAPHKPTVEINATIKDVCLNATDRLNNAKVSKDIYCPPLLLKAMANQYLAQFKTVAYDPFNSKLENAPFTRIPKLYLSSILRRL